MKNAGNWTSKCRDQLGLRSHILSDPSAHMLSLIDGKMTHSLSIGFGMLQFANAPNKPLQQANMKKTRVNFAKGYWATVGILTCDIEPHTVLLLEYNVLDSAPLPLTAQEFQHFFHRKPPDFTTALPKVVSV